MFVSAVAAICVAAGLAADASGPAPTGDDAHVDAYEVHRFSFEEDADYDRQPDGWSRRRGPGFPQYVRSMIDRDTAAHGRQSLLVELNGAAFACYSPLQPVDGDHSYVLRACIRSAGLSGDAALVSISLLDSTRRRLARYLSRPVTGEHRRWATVEIGPFRPGPDRAFWSSVVILPRATRPMSAGRSGSTISGWAACRSWSSRRRRGCTT